MEKIDKILLMEFLCFLSGVSVVVMASSLDMTLIGVAIGIEVVSIVSVFWYTRKILK